MQDSDSKEKQSRHQKYPGTSQRPIKASKLSGGAVFKRRKTTIILSVASIAILASIGIEVIIRDKNPLHLEQVASIDSPKLRILADEEDYDLPKVRTRHDEGELGNVALLERQNKIKTIRIQELIEELNQTKSRIHRLKNDILMSAGGKEEQYENRLSDLQHQLISAEMEIQRLRLELAASNRLIENKRSELNNLSSNFDKTKTQLQEEIALQEERMEQARHKAAVFLQKFQEKLGNKSDSEDITVEELLEIFNKANEHIAFLEAQIAHSEQRADLEAEKANSLLAALEKVKSELIESKEQILTLAAEADKANELLAALENSKNTFAESNEQILSLADEPRNTGFRAIELDSNLNAHSIQAQDKTADEAFAKLLAKEETKSKELEKKLIAAQEQLRTLSKRVIELEEELSDSSFNDVTQSSETFGKEAAQHYIQTLENRLTKAEATIHQLRTMQKAGTTKQQYYNQYVSNDRITFEQEKLIKSLESSLAVAEDNNRKLERRLKNAQSSYAPLKNTNNFDDKTLADLQEKVDTAELRVFELETELAASTKNSAGQHNEILSLQNEVNKHKKALAAAQKQLALAQNQLAAAQNQLASNEQEYSALQRLYSEEMQKASAANAIVSQLNETGQTASFEESYYKDRISLLEKALEVHKNSLLAAQQELLQMGDENEKFEEHYHQMESKFNSKIQELAQKNRVLEEQLIAVEQHSKIQWETAETDNEIADNIEEIHEQLRTALKSYEKERQKNSKNRKTNAYPESRHAYLR